MSDDFLELESLDSAIIEKELYEYLDQSAKYNDYYSDYPAGSSWPLSGVECAKAKKHPLKEIAKKAWNSQVRREAWNYIKYEAIDRVMNSAAKIKNSFEKVVHAHNKHMQDCRNAKGNSMTCGSVSHR